MCYEDVRCVVGEALCLYNLAYVERRKMTLQKQEHHGDTSQTHQPRIIGTASPIIVELQVKNVFVQLYSRTSETACTNGNVLLYASQTKFTDNGLNVPHGAIRTNILRTPAIRSHVVGS